MAFKPYLVKFSFSMPETARLYIAAETPDAAKEAATQVIPPDYENVQVLSVEEHVEQPMTLQ